MMHCSPSRLRTKAGFSLVEMAVVLAIIGLLVGGVLVGQDMMATAKIDRMGRDIVQYGGAVEQFRQRFRAWPGDMTNATNYWGTDADGCPTHTNRVKKTATCNGNGNLQIAGAEIHRAWQHLADAGLIQGTYTGVSGAAHASNSVVGNENAPGSTENSAYTLVNSLNNAGTFITETRNTLVYGATTTQFSNGGLITGEDLAKLDSKHDDGKPAYGTFQAYNNTTRANCVNSDTATTAIYQLNNKTRGCAAIYIFPQQQ